MRGRLLAVVPVVALLASACGGSGSGRTPLIVDTDLSSDDAVALLYLAQDPGVDLRAVTVSGTGLVHCPPGARAEQYERWRRPAFVVDVSPGPAEGFSLDALTDRHFVARTAGHAVASS